MLCKKEIIFWFHEFLSFFSPKHLLKDNGACVRVCPPNKKTVNGECVPCNGPCPKICHFNGNAGKGIIHDGNINSLLNCTVIEGSLTILDSSFNGFQVMILCLFIFII